MINVNVFIFYLFRIREKTPEYRATPIGMETFSDVDSDTYSQPPKTPDIHLSDTEELPLTPSPSGAKSRRSTAYEALIALGLDDFSCDITFLDESPDKVCRSFPQIFLFRP